MHSDNEKVRKEQLLCIRDLKIYCVTQYSEQVHRDSYSTILAANCRAVSHAIRVTDERTRKSLN